MYNIMKESAELVLIPCNLRGHIAAALEFAKLVVDREDRISVTVLIPKLSHHDSSLTAYTDSLVASFAPWERIRFVAVASEDASASDATTNPFVASSRFVESLKLPVKKLVDEMVRGSVRRLAGFVVDMMFVSMADLAEVFGIPTYVFWTGGAGFFSLKLHLLHLRDRGENSFKDCDDSESLDVPEFIKLVPSHALPFVLFDGESASVLFDDVMSRIKKTQGVILNACIEIEPHVISSLMASGDRSPRVYPIGPVLNLIAANNGNDAFSGFASLTDSENIVDWLDSQPPSSVMFLCFGSFGSFSTLQVKEIAFALERTELPFLWTLRVPPAKGHQVFTSEVCEDLAAILPEGFLERTSKMGRVIGWAPQAAVLAHPAVGGFVSHCGWNSLLESLWFGVPIAAWPLYAEQQFNAFEMVTELGLAVAVKPGGRTDHIIMGVGGELEATVVSAEEIEAAMRNVMDGKSAVRKRVKETSEKCRKAVIEGGSSLSSLDSFVSDVFESMR